MPALFRDFHFAGQALRVEADTEPLLWLQDFVEPQFAARDTAVPAQTLPGQIPAPSAPSRDAPAGLQAPAPAPAAPAAGDEPGSKSQQVPK